MEVAPRIAGLEPPVTLDEQAIGEVKDAESVASAGQQPSRVLITGSLQRAVTVRYEAGESAAGIARTLGIGKTTVLKVVHGSGVVIRHPRLTPEQCAEVCGLYQAGHSQVEIARKFDRDPGSVWHILHRAGLVGRR